MPKEIVKPIPMKDLVRTRGELVFDVAHRLPGSRDFFTQQIEAFQGRSWLSEQEQQRVTRLQEKVTREDAKIAEKQRQLEGTTLEISSRPWDYYELLKEREAALKRREQTKTPFTLDSLINARESFQALRKLQDEIPGLKPDWRKGEYVDPRLEGIVKPRIPIDPRLQYMIFLLKGNQAEGFKAGKELGKHVRLSAAGAARLLNNADDVLKDTWRIFSKEGRKGGYALRQVEQIGDQESKKLEPIDPALEEIVRPDVLMKRIHQQILLILKDNKDKQWMTSPAIAKQVNLSSESVRTFLRDVGNLLTEEWQVLSHLKAGFGFEQVKEIDGRIEYVYPGLEGMVNPEVAIDPKLRAVLRILKENVGKKRMTAEKLAELVGISPRTVIHLMKQRKKILAKEWEITSESGLNGRNGGYALEQKQHGIESSEVDPRLERLVKPGVPIDRKLQELLLILKDLDEEGMTGAQLSSMVGLHRGLVKKLLLNNAVLVSGWKVVGESGIGGGFRLEQVREVDGKIEYIYPGLEGIVKPDQPVPPKLRTILRILKSHEGYMSAEQLGERVNLSAAAVSYLLDKKIDVLTQDWQLFAEPGHGGGYSLEHIAPNTPRAVVLQPGEPTRIIPLK